MGGRQVVGKCVCGTEGVVCVLCACVCMYVALCVSVCVVCVCVVCVVCVRVCVGVMCVSVCVHVCERECVCRGGEGGSGVASLRAFSQCILSVASDQCARAAVTDIDARLVVGEQWIIDPAHVTAALDAHRGVAAVAEQGLASLRSLSVAEANKVSWWA